MPPDDEEPHSLALWGSSHLTWLVRPASDDFLPVEPTVPQQLKILVAAAQCAMGGSQASRVRRGTDRSWSPGMARAGRATSASP